MRNASQTTLSFTLFVPSPFSLVEARCSSAQFGLLGRTNIGEPGTFVMPPDSSLQAIISFLPARRRRRHQTDSDAGGSEVDDSKSTASGISASTHFTTRTALADALPVDIESAHRTTVSAELAISFANGTEQRFPLLAVITTPFLQVSPPTIVFAHSHISHAHSATMQITNPTEAEAVWSIGHTATKLQMPGIAAAAALKAATDAGIAPPIDDPRVFMFESMSGSLPGTGGERPQPTPLIVRFVPAEPGRYQSAFIFKVRATHETLTHAHAHASSRLGAVAASDAADARSRLATHSTHVPSPPRGSEKNSHTLGAGSCSTPGKAGHVCPRRTRG